MASDTEALYFSYLAYAGPNKGQVFWDDALSRPGFENWTYLTESLVINGGDQAYFGVAFKNTVTGEIVVANRGSVSAYDWGVSDRDIFHEKLPDAFHDALDFANLLAAQNPSSSIFVTGHSLGGAEAQYVAAELGISGTTFAAPGVEWAVPAGTQADVHNYVYVGEPIANFDTHLGTTTTLFPDGPTQFLNAAFSLAVDEAIASTGAIGKIIASHAGLFLLHGTENYREHFGITDVPSFDSGSINPVLGIFLVLTPIEPQSTLPVSIGGTATISLGFLSSFDPLFGSEHLTYLVTAAPAHGTLLVNGQPADRFTQADIDNNRVSYRHHGQSTAHDSFSFVLSDPRGNHTPIESFRIAIVETAAPVIDANRPLSVGASGGAYFSKDVLSAVALQNEPSAIRYQLATAPRHGVLLVNGTPAATFTQADIDNGAVTYRAKGDGARRDGFAFVVVDGEGDRTEAQTFTIDIAAGVSPPGWHLIDEGNFDGDGSSDLLWRHDDGSTAIRLDGGAPAQVLLAAPGASWRPVGTGDFDADATPVSLLDGTTIFQSIIGAPPPGWPTLDLASANGTANPVFFGGI